MHLILHNTRRHIHSITEKKSLGVLKQDLTKVFLNWWENKDCRICAGGILKLKIAS